jgi:hypothetical protein
MTDNASAYRSKAFRAAVTAVGARHKRTRPYTPRTNGKAERFIQTSLRKWVYAQPYASSQERSAALTPWLHHYNTARPHAGWHNARQQSDSNPSCLVRPKGPLLRPDLRPMTTTGADRGKDRQRRPAKAGAKRPCGGPLRWSHSLKEGPYAPRSEERSWKRQLVTSCRREVFLVVPATAGPLRSPALCASFRRGDDPRSLGLTRPG